MLENQARLLLVDDDETYCQVLAAAFESRGFYVAVAHDVPSAILLAEKEPPEFAVVDLKMPGPSGLELVERLSLLDEHTKTVVLTGYASIATAVQAIKLGAVQYITKPANADEIIQAFGDTANSQETISDTRPSPNRLEWEYLQKVLSENNGNISETARALGMHRRTLQRKMNKFPTRR